MVEVKTGKNKYRKVSRSKEKTTRAVYEAKCKEEREKFRNFRMIRNVMPELIRILFRILLMSSA